MIDTPDHQSYILMSLFTDRVCRAFGLGGPVDVVPLGAGANLLWRFSTASESYAVKELPQEDYDALLVAAGFEREVFESGAVRMAEPIADPHGNLVHRLTGSRGFPASVRVHRFVSGNSIGKPADALTVENAGAALAVIQDLGARRTGPAKYLWRGTADSVLERFGSRWPEYDSGSARRVLERAAEVVAESTADAEPAMSHCDHKPENCLIDGESLVVLDWDEAGYCDPRIEAVESGLRWCWIDGSGPDPDRFAASRVDIAAAAENSGNSVSKIGRNGSPVTAAGSISWSAAVSENGPRSPPSRTKRRNWQLRRCTESPKHSTISRIGRRTSTAASEDIFDCSEIRSGNCAVCATITSCSAIFTDC